MVKRRESPLRASRFALVGYPVRPVRVTLGVTCQPSPVLEQGGSRGYGKGMTCGRCGRDKEKYAFCCDQGPLGQRKRDDVAFEKALSSLLEKGWAKVIEVEGVPHVTLTERGHMVIRAEEAAAAAWN